MTYPYGMQNMPKVGNGLGGLPRRAEGGQGLGRFNPRVIYFQVALGMQLYEILKGETSFFRVTVVGGGGGGGGYGQTAEYSGQVPRAGGGGGGLAASAILPVLRNTTIELSVGAAGVGGVSTSPSSYGPANGTTGGDSTAKFLDNFLLGGGGGRSLDGSVSPGGIGSGGIENHNGGAASIPAGRASSGAGAAGMYHDGDTYNAAFSDNTGGGAGASTSGTTSTVSAGGGGAGASGGSILAAAGSGFSSITAGKKLNRGATVIGFAGGDGVSSSGVIGEGGIGGGGGGGGGISYNGANGGVGIVRIELW